MKTCKLTILDQVNIKFQDLDPACRRDIVEALKFMVPYARHTPMFKMGRWDGKVGFATVGGGSYFNLLGEYILPVLIRHGYDLANMEIEDLREEIDISFPEIDETYISHIVWPVGHPLAGEPIVLRDYQVDAINNYFKNVQSSQIISTGGGKTAISACLSMACERYGRTLTIVPSKSLVEQTEEDFRNIGLDVGVYYGDRKEKGRRHTIATWQSLGALCKKKDDFGKVTEEFNELIQDVKCVIVDEMHTAKSTVLKDLLTGPLAKCPIRWGMTGTIPKEKFESVPLLLSIGPVVGEIRAKELQEKEVLAQLDIEILQLNDPNRYNNFADEYAYLTTDPTRLEWIVDFCKTLRGNTLVLVDRIECGEYLHNAIPNSVFISGDVKNKDRKKEYKSVTDDTEKIIIATSGVAAVGINVPAIHNLVLVAATKSFVRTIQSIGRILRKTKQKNSAKVYDITSVCKYAAKHLTERKKYYKEAGYPFSIRKIDY